MEIKTWFGNQFTTEKIKKHFTFSIQEIAFAGIFTGLWIISSKFLTIDFGIMRAGIVYVWAILIGLTTKPALGVVVAVIADTISLSISSTGIGGWMWEYAIIYPGITLFASLFKQVLRIKNKWAWWSIIGIINAAVIIGIIALAAHKIDPAYIAKMKASRNEESKFDFTDQMAKVAIWTCLGIIVVALVCLITLTIKKPEYAKYLIIYTLVSATIILFIWIWGPIAQVKYLIRLYGHQKDGSSYWKLYDLYFTARVIKTPVIIPIYTAIVAAGWTAYDQVSKYSGSKNRW